MKFEQAYYTWDWEQLTQYQGGFGIHASSNMNGMFIEYCSRMGARFNPETEPETAEFLAYSQNFDTNVYAYISPREDVSGKNRANMLVHILVPEEREGFLENTLLLNLPIATKIKEEKQLESLEIHDVEVDQEELYRRLIEKYNLNPRKMAVLLWRLFQQIGGRTERVQMVIEKSKHEKEEYSIIAKEFMWLLYRLVPADEYFKNKPFTRLTYGVYTTVNKSQIGFWFTDENGGNAAFCIDEDYAEERESIPEVYLKMGKAACASRDELHAFIDELQKVNNKQFLEYNVLEDVFERWKLENGGELSEEKFMKLLPTLLRGMSHSKWHEEFLYLAISRTKVTRIDVLKQLWQHFVNQTNETFSQKNEAEQAVVCKVAFSLLNNMEEMEPSSVANHLGMLPEGCREAVSKLIENSYRDSEDMINKVKNQIDNSDDIRALQKMIAFICHFKRSFDLEERIIEKAKQIYNKSGRSDREKLSDMLLNSKFDSEWYAYLNEWLSDKQGLEDDLDVWENKMSDMELRFCRPIYNQLFKYAEGTDDFQKRERIIVLERKIRQEANGNLDTNRETDFANLMCQWKKEYLHAEMEKANISDLAQYSLNEIKWKESRNKWLLEAERKLNDNMEIEADVYEHLLNRAKEASVLCDRNEVSGFEWKKYNRTLQAVANKNIGWKMCYYAVEFEKEGGFWEEITFDSYREIHFYYEKQPIFKAINKDALYRVWEKSFEGEGITYDDVDFVARRIDGKCERRLFWTRMLTDIIQKEFLSVTDCVNLCTALYETLDIGSNNERQKKCKEIFYNNASVQNFFENAKSWDQIPQNLAKAYKAVWKDFAELAKLEPKLVSKGGIHYIFSSEYLPHDDYYIR